MLGPVCLFVFQAGLKQATGSVGVQGVKPRHLETVVSKAETVPKLILAGPHAGEFGTLIRKEREDAILQLIESKEVVSVSLNDVADYLGGDVDV
jgi:hypothetical protein